MGRNELVFACLRLVQQFAEELFVVFLQLLAPFPLKLNLKFDFPQLLLVSHQGLL